MLKTYKYRLYPTKRQQTFLNSTLEECCWLYNHFLEERQVSWRKEKKTLSYYSQATSIIKLKQEREFLSIVHSQVLQNIAVRIDLAFKAFFRRVKAKENPGYPRFKGKGWYDSITYPQTGFEFTPSGLKLSKIGTLKIKLHRKIEGKVKTCTIKRSPTNKWYATFSCEIVPKHLPKSKKAVGIDVGIESFATLSTGDKIENPRFFRSEEKSLAKAQRKLSKQTKGTLGRKKVKKIVSHIYGRIADRRNNFTHQESRKIINKFGIICIEDLNINQMKKNNFKGLNKSIGDVAWNQFAQYLSYKAENAGRQLIKVNPAYTSQTCSKCGYRQVKKLSDRIHKCSNCNFELDRDHNAALNILALGLQSIGTQSVEAPRFN